MAATFLQFCMSYCSIALLYYDYFLTFPTEVKYIWSRRFTFSTILYICCRYALLANLLYVFAMYNILENCNSWYTAVGFISVAGRAAILIIFTKRTSAIYSKNRIVLFGLSAIATVCIAVDLWHASGETCSGPSPPDIQIANTSLPIIMASFEFIGTALNVYRCFKAVLEQRRCGHRFDDSLMSFMLRESLVYFCGTFFLTLTSAILHFKEPSGFLNKLLNSLTLPVNGLLSARLILNLREWSDKTHVQASVSPASQPADLGRSAMWLPFHAATQFMSPGDFGGDRLDYTRGSLGVDDEIIREIYLKDDGNITEVSREPPLSYS